MVNVNRFINSGVILGQDAQKIWLGYPSLQKERLRGINERPRFFFSTFHGKIKEVFCEEVLCISAKNLLDAIEKFSVSTPEDNYSYLDANLTSQEFEKFFNMTKDAIDSGQIEKAVPYGVKTFSSPMSKADKINAFNNILNLILKTNAHIFGYWDSQSGFLGATPEILFQSDADCLHSMALAGTRCAQDNPESLLSDPKELHEHGIVVKFLAENLKTFGDLKIENTKLKPGPYVWHLETLIEVKLNAPMSDSQILELVDRLHPTPALGGYPQSKTKKILEEFDQDIPRGVFGGPIGVIHPNGASHFVVMIRGIQWTQETKKIFAGCGVVKQSDLEQEWCEVQLKIRAIEKSLGMAKQEANI